MDYTLDSEIGEEKTDWSTYAVTLRLTDTEIIRDIIRLYNSGLEFAVDATYSTGAFWKNLPQPVLKFDIAPVIEGVTQADARNLPLGKDSVGSIMFDPPFVMKDTTNRVPNGIIEKRFSGYKDAKELWGMYDDALKEFYRILEPNGIVAFKCQDVVSSGRQWWSHIEIYMMALKHGFVAKDLFVRGRKSVMWAPTYKNQKHAKKNHCFWWVFKKEVKKKNVR